MDYNSNSNNSANDKSSSLISFENFSILENLEYTQYKHMYVDLCDDLVTGILLSKIVYWFGKSKKGEQRAKHLHQGRLCIVKKKSDWWEECRISEKQFDRSIGKLSTMGIVSTEIHYNPFSQRSGERATFIFLAQDVLMQKVNAFLDKEKEGVFTNPDMGFSQTTQREVSENDEREVSEHDLSEVSSYSTMTTYNDYIQGAKAPPLSKEKKQQKTKKADKPLEPKTPFRSDVFLAKPDYDQLLAQYGDQQLSWMLDKLNAWRIKKGRPKCGNDMGDLIRGGWVLKAYEDEQQEKHEKGRIETPSGKSPRQIVEEAKSLWDNSNGDYMFEAKEDCVIFIQLTSTGFGFKELCKISYKDKNFQNNFEHCLRKYSFFPKKVY